MHPGGNNATETDSKNGSRHCGFCDSGGVVVLLVLWAGAESAGVRTRHRLMALASESSESGSDSESGSGSGSLSQGSDGSFSISASLPDPLNLGASPPGVPGDYATSNTLPPYTSLNSLATVSPNLAMSSHQALSLDLDRRIKQTENLLNRMVWQLNRETSWANSVHDIIQNYQYKYTKVLANIKKHSERTGKMRQLAAALKKARLHEILEEDLAKATRELTELAVSSAETSEDEGSYSSLKDRVSLMKADLEKMAHKKINKVIHKVQDSLKQVGADAIPAPSSDTLVDLISEGSSKAKSSAGK